MVSYDQSKWIENALTNCGLTLCGVKKRTETPLSIVYEIKTGEGVCFFKTGIGLEAWNTQELYNIVPSLIPEIIGSDIERNWILTKDGGSRLSEIDSEKIWKDAAMSLGGFHRGQSDKRWSIFPHNNYGSKEITKSFNEFWFESDSIRPYDIKNNLVEFIRSASLEINESILTVESMELDSCVCHGDAQPMNCLYGETGLLWFDWRETHVTSPIIDIGWFLSWLMPPRGYLKVTVSEKFLVEIYNVYLKEIGVSNSSASIYNAMQYALIQRIVYFHNQSGKYEECRLYVEYLVKLLFRVLNRKIG